MSALLTEQETIRLTGYTKPSKQIEWLERNDFQEGVDYFINAAGYPIVWPARRDKAESEPELGPVP